MHGPDLKRPQLPCMLSMSSLARSLLWSIYEIAYAKVCMHALLSLQHCSVAVAYRVLVADKDFSNVHLWAGGWRPECQYNAQSFRDLALHTVVTIITIQCSIV